ncbi:MAG: hypothetical protein JO235_00265, partial [Chroococcidiopsidaceae cyanobacterium CP_BM_RX_35]|nr:hypothetical protein [Chroococcidiopsidaceae cyanobacterium CP_BM_RX_35]
MTILKIERQNRDKTTLLFTFTGTGKSVGSSFIIKLLILTMVRFLFRQKRQVIAFFLSLGIALGLGLTTPASADFPLLPLLLQGGQYLQLSNVSTSQQVQLGQEINQQLH